MSSDFKSEGDNEAMLEDDTCKLEKGEEGRGMKACMFEPFYRIDRDNEAQNENRANGYEATRDTRMTSPHAHESSRELRRAFTTPSLRALYEN
jgi:hypothetical protein